MSPLILTRGKTSSALTPKRPWVVNRDSPQFGGLAAFYSFIPHSVGLSDLSGNGFGGTFEGTGHPKWSPSSSGKWGLEFTGNQRVELPNAVGDAIETAGTVAFMFDNLGTPPNSTLFDTRSGASDGWQVLPHSDGTMGFDIDTGGRTTINVSEPQGFSIIVARYTGAKMFLDSTEDFASATKTGLATRSTTTSIGNRDGSTTPVGAERPIVHVCVYDYAWPDALVHQFLGAKRFDLYYELGKTFYLFVPAVVATTTSKGPFGHPFHGPFAGPIG